MGCSFSTGAQKIEAVLQRFDGVAPRQATDGSVAKVVGRCAPAGATGAAAGTEMRIIEQGPQPCGQTTVMV